MSNIQFGHYSDERSYEINGEWPNFDPINLNCQLCGKVYKHLITRRVHSLCDICQTEQADVFIDCRLCGEEVPHAEYLAHNGLCGECLKELPPGSQINKTV